MRFRIAGSFELDRTAAGHVEVAQTAEANAVRLFAGASHPLAEQLGLAVRVNRQHWNDVFRHHVDRRNAVGGCGRGEDELLGTGVAHADEHVEHTVDVLLVVPQRLLNGFADLLSSGEMNDGVDAFGLHDFGETFAGTRSGDIHAVQAGAFDAGWLAVAQIVNDDDLFAGLMKSVDDVGADVAAPTSDENCHVLAFPPNER